MKVHFYAIETDFSKPKPVVETRGLGKLVEWNGDYSLALVEFENRYYKVKRENIIKAKANRRRKKR
jgi:hypothetical protein